MDERTREWAYGHILAIAKTVRKNKLETFGKGVVITDEILTLATIRLSINFPDDFNPQVSGLDVVKMAFEACAEANKVWEPSAYLNKGN